MIKILSLASYGLATLLISTIAQAGNFETVFGRKADVSSLEKLIAMNDLSKIVAEMEKTGVRFFRVLENENGDEENLEKQTQQKVKYFSFLPTIPKNLEKRLSSFADETQGESAIFVSWNEIGSEKDGNIILLGEFSLPTTLFHEYSHHLFEINNREDTLKLTEQQNQHNSDFAVFNFRKSKVETDRSLLLNPLWRRDIDNAIQDSFKLAHVVQAQTASEEIAVEAGLLKLMYENRSPWFDVRRSHDGIYRYSQGLVNKSKYLNESMIALMDVVRTDGENMDKGTTEEEVKNREQFYSPIRTKIHNFIATEVAMMQTAVDKSKAYLEFLENSEP